MKKVSLVERLIALAKGGDEAKFTRFESKLQKYIKKQISMLQDEIDSLKEKIVDAKEVLNDVILDVDSSRVNTTEGADGYCATYMKAVRSQRNVIKGFENQIESLEEQIAEYKADEQVIYSVDSEKKA